MADKKTPVPTKKGPTAEEFMAGLMKALGGNNNDERDNLADTGIEFKGTKITLPADPERMDYDRAIETLVHIRDEQNQTVSFLEYIDAFPSDGLVAFKRAIDEIQGYARQQATQFLFWRIPPKMETVEIGFGETVQVPVGKLAISGIPGDISASPTTDPRGVPVLAIHGEVKKMDLFKIQRLVNRTREIVKEASIYKGKAIKLVTKENGDMDITSKPKFINTKNIHPEQLVLNENELRQVELSIWTPIINTDACIQHKIPLKRGVLLEGPYGCGKTMTATVTAKKCEENGWTFIMLENVLGLKQALEFARRYEPAVVFAEDVDRAVAVRDERGNDILNTIDGVLSKDSQIMTVLTTNYVEKLQPAMLRPGRLDAIISIREPREEAAEKLLRSYGQGLIAMNEDISKAAAETAGSNPAFIRETIERAKIAMIMERRQQVTCQDILDATLGMKAHIELLKPKPVELSDAEKLGQILLRSVGKNVEDKIATVDTKASEILEYVKENM